MARKNLDTQNYGFVEGNDNSYSVLPEGEYLTSIYDVKDIEFAKRGGNAGRPAINVQFRLVDGRPHANRRLFDRVPMFATFAPKEGKEKGSQAFRFFQFWSAVLGIKRSEFEKQYKALEAEGKDPFEVLLDNDELLGKQVVVKVGHEQSEYHYQKAVDDGTIGDRDEDHEDFTRETILDIIPASADKGEAAPTLPSGGTFTL